MNKTIICNIVLLFFFLVGGCGTSSLTHRETVIDRKDGHTSRPKWANPDHPWSRSQNTVHVLGYTIIDSRQRLEAGYKIADSYAKAEFIQFLSVRVVSVLEDTIAEQEVGLLSEKIRLHSKLLVNDLPIADHYWERHSKKGNEEIHIFARLDIQKAFVKKIIDKVFQSNSQLSSDAPPIIAAIDARWDKFAAVGQISSTTDLLPPGVEIPTWARAGDEEDDQNYAFVCHGFAENDKKAAALANAQCDEKLCRLFGMVINAETSVTETLDSLDVNVKISQRCANVVVQKRQTIKQSSNCDAKGCIHWTMQTYPKDAYKKERARLEDVLVIERQVIIQEGDVAYADPAPCIKTLKTFASLKEITHRSLQKRSKILNRAIKQCANIDERHSTIATAVNTQLTKGLFNFAVQKERDIQSPVQYFLFAPNHWQEKPIDQRSTGERVAAIKKFIDVNMLPVNIIETVHQDTSTPKQVEDVLKLATQKFDFFTGPISSHHLVNIHTAILFHLGHKGNRHYSKVYENWLIEKAKSLPIGCLPGEKGPPGVHILKYFAKDGWMNDAEWAAGFQIIKNSPNDPRICFENLFNKNKPNKKHKQHIEQMVRWLRNSTNSEINKRHSFEALIEAVPWLSQWDLYAEWGNDIAVSLAQKTALAAFMLKQLKRFPHKSLDTALSLCRNNQNHAAQILTQFPSLTKPKGSPFCSCSNPDTQTLFKTFGQDQVLTQKETDFYFEMLNNSTQNHYSCFNEMSRLNLNENQRKHIENQTITYILSRNDKIQHELFQRFLHSLEPLVQYDYFLKWHDRLPDNHGHKIRTARGIIDALKKFPQKPFDMGDFCHSRAALFKHLSNQVTGVHNEENDKWCTCEDEATVNSLREFRKDGNIDSTEWNAFKQIFTGSRRKHGSCADALFQSARFVKHLDLADDHRKQLIGKMSQLIIQETTNSRQSSISIFADTIWDLKREEVHFAYQKWGSALKGSQWERQKLLDLLSTSYTRPITLQLEHKKALCESSASWIAQMLKDVPGSMASLSSYTQLCWCLDPVEGVSDAAKNAIQHILLESETRGGGDQYQCKWIDYTKTPRRKKLRR